jgi:hypothetical protein
VLDFAEECTMPIYVELCDDGQVIHFKLSDPFTMEELFKGFGQSMAFRDSVAQVDPNRRVHLLLDLMDTRQAPPGILQSRQMPALTHTVRGEIVVAVEHAYPRSIAETILRVMRADGHFFNTLESAWNYIHKLIENPMSLVDDIQNNHS